MNEVEVRDKYYSQCMPNKKIEKSFSLIACHWDKLNLDKSHVAGTPQREFKNTWIKIGGMRDVLHKRKNIVIDTIDGMCKKDGSSREHVAHELDILMIENNSTVTKMWRNWRQTGDFFTNVNEVTASENTNATEFIVSVLTFKILLVTNDCTMFLCMIMKDHEV